MTTDDQGKKDFDRLSRLESATTGHRVQLDSLRDEIHGVKQTVDSLANEMRHFIRAAGRTNWSVLISFGAFLLAFGAIAAAPFMRDLNRVEARSSKVEDQLAAIAPTRWSRSDHEAYRAADEASKREIRDQITEHERTAVAINAEQTTRLVAVEEVARKTEEEFHDHISNGHPNTVIDRIERDEELLTELRDRLSKIEWIVAQCVETAKLKDH